MVYKRRSTRLPGYDYAQAGAYFVTLVTHARASLFGEIVNGVMHLNRRGLAARDELRRLEQRFPKLQLDACVIMPNHIHAILIIRDVGATHSPSMTVGATRSLPDKERDGKQSPPDQAQAGLDGSPLRAAYDGLDESRVRAPHGPPPGSLGAYIGQFKSRLAKRLKLPMPFWQRNYYEHIIRNDDELNRIRVYIQDNPIHWEEDEEYIR
ncbi:MAG: hypothetical protein JXB15_01260 [Anaerolineales bacterium]|nr:hypothetical protein [Anaerolineales bacterium]